jgi:hypothetical protein
VREALGQPKLRIHDLRHSFASVAVNIGYDLRIVGGLLGHRDLETTAGYAHLDRTQVAKASERVGRHLERALQAPAKSQSSPAPRSPFGRFVTSKLSMRSFCEAQGLELTAFRRDLLKWRTQHRGRV